VLVGGYSVKSSRDPKAGIHNILMLYGNLTLIYSGNLKNKQESPFFTALKVEMVQTDAG
jgi:hypothetical protein